MEDRYYFAYGDNMNLEQMKYRCPSTRKLWKMSGLKIIGWHFEERFGNGVATVLPKREAVSKEFYGKSQKRVRRVWISMKDSQVFMGKNRFR